MKGVREGRKGRNGKEGQKGVAKSGEEGKGREEKSRPTVIHKSRAAPMLRMVDK